MAILILFTLHIMLCFLLYSGWLILSPFDSPSLLLSCIVPHHTTLALSCLPVRYQSSLNYFDLHFYFRVRIRKNLGTVYIGSKGDKTQAWDRECTGTQCKVVNDIRHGLGHVACHV
ncbi:hypothetical protein B0T24DRAFT_134802 [Lasiosphaeria ovina]|uniref:Uncharacterized protein n=1 Tax=Lasiosphaeria ovina TaxID=92902 RepID=A0AAE0JRT8_9PEZI|nr:hypothetical protein B0T24DRAFT_134802 [Lasiosphaeria ovina]